MFAGHAACSALRPCLVAFTVQLPGASARSQAQAAAVRVPLAGGMRMSASDMPGEAAWWCSQASRRLRRIVVLHVLQPVGANCGCPGGQTILAAIKHGILYSVQADPMQALDVRTMTPLIMQPSMNANPIKRPTPVLSLLLRRC